MVCSPMAWSWSKFNGLDRFGPTIYKTVLTCVNKSLAHSWKVSVISVILVKREGISGFFVGLLYWPEITILDPVTPVTSTFPRHFLSCLAGEKAWENERKWESTGEISYI